MALDATRLGNALAAAVMAPNASVDAQNQVRALWTAIAQEIINEVKQSTVTVATGIPVSTTGTAAAQSGATTATGSASIT